MTIQINPSDLYYRYRHKKTTRRAPKFSGKPDPHPYDRDDLYEVIAMLSAVMDHFNTCDARILHRLEELAGDEMPPFIRSREAVFDFLVAVMSDVLASDAVSGQQGKSNPCTGRSHDRAGQKG
ncbi:MAG: hypothetical protein P8Y73_06825 [Desulfuromonadales bacterium]|jgi:hypothetical protein